MFLTLLTTLFSLFLFPHWQFIELTMPDQCSLRSEYPYLKLNDRRERPLTTTTHNSPITEDTSVSSSSTRDQLSSSITYHSRNVPIPAVYQSQPSILLTPPARPPSSTSRTHHHTSGVSTVSGQCVSGTSASILENEKPTNDTGPVPWPD